MASVDEDGEWLSTAAYFAESAVGAAEPSSAAAVYDALLPYEDRFVVEGIAARTMGSVAHYLGKLAAFLGRTGEAERHFERAISAHGRLGAVLWQARSRREYARMLAAAGDPRVSLREELTRDAAAVFSAHGLAGDAAEAAELGGKAPAGDRAATPAPAGNVFRREGEYWTVAFGGSIAHLKDSKGLRDIAALLAAPGREIAALDLVARDAAGEDAALAQAARRGDAGEMLDERARAAYKARIADLHEEIDEASSHADAGRETAAREELEALAGQLAGAYGLGGRARRAGDPAERARKAVTERIRDAVAKLARENPVLHRHLKASIRTGTFCSYSPEHPGDWTL